MLFKCIVNINNSIKNRVNKNKAMLEKINKEIDQQLEQQQVQLDKLNTMANQTCELAGELLVNTKRV